MAHTEEKELTKHVCQPGKSNLPTGSLPNVWLLSPPVGKGKKEVLKFSSNRSVLRVFPGGNTRQVTFFILPFSYEIQAESDTRGKGLGKFLMQILEMMAHRLVSD